MPVSERERAYMARIGRLKAASHAEAAAKHQALPLAARLRQSWLLFPSFRDAARSGEGEEVPSR